jgi:hypothetical protein
MSKSDPDDKPELHQRRAGETKIQKSRLLALRALDDLLEKQPAATIRLATICRTGGISTDSLYKPHHADLRQTLTEKLAAAVATQAESGKKRRYYLSATAEERISQLERENQELKSRLTGVYQALNVLAQLVEELPEDEPGGGKVVRLPPSRPRKGA